MEGRLQGLARRVEAVALVAAGALALLFHLTLPSKLPGEPDFEAAAAAVAQEKQPGDVVLLHPWWTERARLFMPDGVPVVGFLGSDRAELETAPRIWVLSQPDLPRAGASSFWDAFRPGRAPLGEERRFGTLRLSLHRNGRFRPTLFSAAESIARARAYVESSPGVKKADCAPDPGGFSCPGGAARVQVVWREVHFEPRRCVSMYPPGGDDRLVVEFPDGAPAGDRLSLEAGVVWEWAAYTDPRLRPVRAGVEGARGEALAQVSIAPAQERWQRDARPRAEAGPLKLWLSAVVPDNRETCVDLRIQGPAAGGGS
ncbi:MAG TPA: hypothetical protein VIG99_10660 [Myxococcaceae bacterium]